MALVGELFGSIVRYAGGPVTCERCPRGSAPVGCVFHVPRGSWTRIAYPNAMVYGSHVAGEIVTYEFSAPLRSQKG